MEKRTYRNGVETAVVTVHKDGSAWVDVLNADGRRYHGRAYKEAAEVLGALDNGPWREVRNG
jgi:hypothetical protein